MDAAADRRDEGSNYEDQANQNHAKNLKGKLLLAHGTMDDNVPPYSTLLVVDALIKANKDFDLLMLPERAPRLRRRRELHDAPALGLLCKPLARHGTAKGVRLKPPATGRGSQ